MAIGEISENEFEEIIDGTVDCVYLAIVFNSEAINWLASDDRTTAGVIRRDRDQGTVSYSWGSYDHGECIGYGCELPSEHDALVACMRAMTEAGR